MLKLDNASWDVSALGRMAWARVAVVAAVCALLLPAAAFAQQRGSISGKVVDPDGLALPGATVTVKEQNTGITRTATTASTGAYTVPNLDPGTYTISVNMPGFSHLTRKDQPLSAGNQLVLDLKLTGVGLSEEVTVEGQAPLVETTKSAMGGSLSKNEIEDVPSNFRNFTALTQLIPGMTPNPAASSFEGGQVVANGTPAQSNVYLLDGAYNNDDRLGGSQGTQVRLVLDNIGEYQVLSNSYSAEYGGGAGAVINMVSRGGTNDISGRVYTYFRDDKFNSRGHFLPDGAPKPDERTLQYGAGIGGPIVKNRAHFYLTIERDEEDIAGQKLFPDAAAPLATDFVGAFQVRATNYFGRVDVQLNQSNFLSVRAVREKAPTRGEGFNTNTETPDAQNWEADLDELAALALTSTISDRASNVFRFGMIHEQLDTGEQAYFDDDVNAIGYAGRDPFSIGQENIHPSYITGIGGTGTQTTIQTFTIDDAFSYFVPSLWGGEHTFKFGGGMSFNQADPRQQQFSGSFDFATDTPYDPNNPASFPRQFDITLGPLGVNGYAFVYKDQRQYAFIEDKWRASKKLTLNLGVRYDHQKLTPASKFDIGPRLGFAYDLKGNGNTVIRGGIGKFYLYMPVSLGLNLQQSGILTQYPSLSINAASDTCGCVLRPDMIPDSAGNPGVAQLSQAAQEDLARRREAVLAGTTFNRNPQIDDPDRQMANQIAYSFGVSQQLTQNMAISVDYVGNKSYDQTGLIDLNEPVNRVRPGPAGFDPNGEIIPPEARGTNYQRVLEMQSNEDFDGNYNSLQVALVKRMASRWSGRVSYTLQRSHYTGLGNPDSRRVWLDNDIRADYGLFASNRTHVLAATGTVNPWRTLNISAVVSAISGSPINETVGRDVNGDNDNTDRPIQGVDDLPNAAGVALPIRSEIDSQGRAVINGLEGPGSFLIDMSLRYQIPLGSNGRRGLDLFYDMFNVTNRVNYVNPTGNRASATFMVPTAAQFPRQMQMGARIRF
jgi:carboxypeptidase family protein/TonB-dependent receptor-like protein